MNQHSGQSRVGLENRIAVLIVALCYGCCATLLIPSTLMGFAPYEFALPVAYDLARTSSIIALIAGFIAAAVLPKLPLGAGLGLLLAVLIAGTASLFGAATTDTPSSGTVILANLFFFVSGPILIASAARQMIATGVLRQVLAALLVAFVIATGAVGAYFVIGDGIGPIRIALALFAIGMVAIAAFAAWRAWPRRLGEQPA